MLTFFIKRPRFAMVIALVITLLGAIALRIIPVEQYPQITPPVVNVSASWPGASSADVAEAIATPLETQLNGVDHMLYMESTSSDEGTYSLNITFAAGTDPDLAAIDVQNRVAQAVAQLPAEAQQNGVQVRKRATNLMMGVSLYSPNNTHTPLFVSNYASTQVREALSRLPGVGQVQMFGARDYSMRIWLRPDRMNALNVTTDDVAQALREQNVQGAAGQVGTPPVFNGQQQTLTINGLGRLNQAEDFADIIIRAGEMGQLVRLKDVATIELGSRSYSSGAQLNGHDSAYLGIYPTPSANALRVADAVRAELERLSTRFPDDLVYEVKFDTTSFVAATIKEIGVSLALTMLAVVVVVSLFLQSWRATLIVALAIPVSLVGTFAVLYTLGYSANTLSLFAIILALTMVVDDAIVVVENVERIMRDEGLPAREATEKSMGEISGALVAIALVLSAVFLPMAFFGGSTGVIYRQFSVTIISAMMLSVVVALTLTPALCGALLSHSKPHTKGFFGAFNRLWGRTEAGYQHRVLGGLRRGAVMMGAYALICGAMALAMWKLPGSFLPVEDQGEIMVQYTLPAGATAVRTAEVRRQVTDWFLTKEKANTDVIFTVDGFSFSGSGQNAGMAFVSLKNWSQRKGDDNTAQAIALRATKELGTIRDATLFAMTPPSVDGLGQSNGFTFELMASGGTDRDSLMKLRSQLLAAANQSSELQSVRANDLPQMPQLQVDIDNNKAVSLGLSLSDVTDTLSSAWGGTYVNDFIDRGRVKKVYIQGESDARAVPSDLGKWFVRGSDNSMTPFSAFATTHWQYGPESLVRYNGSAAFEIQGENAAGFSSGAAMDKMEKLADSLPAGSTWAWSGISLQEKLASGQAMSLYAISILVVFLCLAALYESWSVPFSVIMVIPLGLLGAALAATLRGLSNDVYFQVALLTTIGLSSKNAILIVEFAESAVDEGYSLSRAAIRAAQTRLRPIVMTSLAFIAGVLPLAIATGAGANSRVAIGTGIIGGTLTATLLAVFFVPLFFVLVKRLFTRPRPSQE